MGVRFSKVLPLALVTYSPLMKFLISFMSRPRVMVLRPTQASDSQADRCDPGPCAGFILLLGATGDTDPADQPALVAQGQTAAKAHHAGSQRNPGTNGWRVRHQRLRPCSSGQAEASCGIGLVDRNVDRMQEGARHAQKRRQITPGVDHRPADLRTSRVR